jgi:hypothetical protein
MILSELQTRIAKIERRTDRLCGYSKAAGEQARLLGVDVQRYAAAVELGEDALSLVNKCLEEKMAFIEYVEQIVTTALREVFDQDVRFLLMPRYEEKTGLLKGLQFMLQEGALDPELPANSFGAGLVSLVSFIWRLCEVVFSKQTASVLIVDEPLANVSSTCWARVERVLSTVARELGVQVVLVSHSEHTFSESYVVTKKVIDGVPCSVVSLERGA